MKLKPYPDSHFTYCSNIHSGEEWGDHFKQLKLHLPKLKSRLSPNAPFGVGLRLSAKAALELKKGSTLEDFRNWLDSEDLYLFTINGFPYGSFHGERVKDNVYAPDWTSEDRLIYTLNLIEILARLLPDGIDGGISTSPVSYKYWDKVKSGTSEIFEKATQQFAMAAHEMNRVLEETGKEIHLDIEPEPDCLLENGTETIQYFTDWLSPVGADYLHKQFGHDQAKAEDILKKHICVCYDTCHFALEYENAEKAIQSFKDAGIRIGKTQISSALKVDWTRPGISPENVLSRLKIFDEPVYLHQVIELKKDGSYHQYRDLPEALKQFDEANAKEWRIHFHVPLFLDEFGELSSTRDHIKQALPHLLKNSGCTHYEIETYTWEVLPDRFKSDLTDSIEREYRWMLGLVTSI